MKHALTVAGALSLQTLVGLSASEANHDSGAAHWFKMTLSSSVTMDLGGKKQQMTADTEVGYGWRRTDRERTLLLDSLLLKVNTAGAETMNTFMTRGKFVDVRQGKTNEITAEKAPEKLQRLLRDSFNVPLCTLQVDENGTEVKRTIIAGEGAKDLINNGMIANALLFHPPFRHDRERVDRRKGGEHGPRWLREGPAYIHKAARQPIAADVQSLRNTHKPAF